MDILEKINEKLNLVSEGKKFNTGVFSAIAQTGDLWDVSLALTGLATIYKRELPKIADKKLVKSLEVQENTISSMAKALKDILGKADYEGTE